MREWQKLLVFVACAVSLAAVATWGVIQWQLAGERAIRDEIRAEHAEQPLE